MAANANPDLENEEPEEEYITEDDDDADEDESNTETDGDAVESAEDETPPGITPKDLAQGNPKVSATSLVWMYLACLSLVRHIVVLYIDFLFIFLKFCLVIERNLLVM